MSWKEIYWKSFPLQFIYLSVSMALRGDQMKAIVSQETDRKREKNVDGKLHDLSYV